MSVKEEYNDVTEDLSHIRATLKQKEKEISDIKKVTVVLFFVVWYTNYLSY